MKVQVVKKKILRKQLLELGFEEESGKDHVFFYFKYGGKIVVRTKYSHGGKKVRQPILGLISKQLLLNRQEFESLLRGELGLDEYKSILNKKGKIKLPKQETRPTKG